MPDDATMLQADPTRDPGVAGPMVLWVGGRLVYATCTVNSAENQDLVTGFLRERPDFRLLPPGPGWLRPECIQDGFLLCAPHRHGTDAFFAAVLERSS